MTKMTAQGTPLIGICGGYQMLGQMLEDPNNLEHGGSLRGMGLIDTTTLFEEEKVRTRVTGTVGEIDGFYQKLSHTTFTGYEIHMGKTQGTQCHVATLSSGVKDGTVQGNILGSYVHGIFDEGDFYLKLVEILLEKKGIEGAVTENITYETYKNQQYDLLADGLRDSLDMKKIYEILEAGIDEK